MRKNQGIQAIGYNTKRGTAPQRAVTRHWQKQQNRCLQWHAHLVQWTPPPCGLPCRMCPRHPRHRRGWHRWNPGCRHRSWLPQRWRPHGWGGSAAGSSWRSESAAQSHRHGYYIRQVQGGKPKSNQWIKAHLATSHLMHRIMTEDRARKQAKGSKGRVRVAYVREEVGEGERGGGPEEGVRVDDHQDEADVICTRRRVAPDRMSVCAPWSVAGSTGMREWRVAHRSRAWSERRSWPAREVAAARGPAAAGRAPSQSNAPRRRRGCWGGGAGGGSCRGWGALECSCSRGCACGLWWGLVSWLYVGQVQSCVLG